MKIELVKETQIKSSIILRCVAEGSKRSTSKDTHEPVLGKYESLHIQKEENGRYTALAGIGEIKSIDITKIRNITADAVRKILKYKFKSIAVDTSSFIQFCPEQGSALKAIIEGAVIGSEMPGKLKTEKEPSAIEKLEFIVEKPVADAENIKNESVIIGGYVNLARKMTNLPANLMTPKRLADFTKKEAEKTEVDIEVFGKSQLKKMGLNLILAVASGSPEEPVLIKMDYSPTKLNTSKKTPHIILIGKGITFDAGGLDLKSSSAMAGMKEDMAGAAAVISAILCASKFNLSIKITGLIPAAENLPSSMPIKPGDVIKSYSGLAVEIENTDAEGRLILADALSFADTMNADFTVNIATLTGSAKVAMGEEIAPYLTDSDELSNLLEAASKATGEPIWRFPLWKSYEETLNSDIADVKNVGKYGGGVITAALFLKKFIKKTPWAHIDIAATACPNKNQPLTGKGATGFGVRLLIDFIQRVSKKE